MKYLKIGYWKAKNLFLKVCLFVGVITVLQFMYNYSQKNFNTASNKASCSFMVNPSYVNKLKCTAIELLSASKKIGEGLEQVSL